MLYQLSYTPRPESSALTLTPFQRKGWRTLQAAAWLRLSLSIALAVEAATGLEKI